MVGEDPHHVERIADKLRNAAGTSGPGGVFTLALSAIDTALWDIRGKALGVPLATLLGGFRDRVPAYASGALMRTQSLDEVVTAAGRLVERGWTAMKTQLALPGGTSAGAGGRPHPPHPRGDRPRDAPDVRHQPALDRAGGLQHRRADRALPPALAGGRDDLRRLPGPRPHHRQADDADRRRRIRLGHRALPADAGGALGRLSS